MSVLVLAEATQGVFKKKIHEAVQYGANIAKSLNGNVTVLALGTIANDQLQNLAAFGAQKIMHVADARLDAFNSKAYTKAVLTAAAQSGAKVIIATHDVSGKAVAPRVAAALKAGMVAGAISYPDLSKGFTVKKSVFAGKAFAHVKLTAI